MGTWMGIKAAKNLGIFPDRAPKTVQEFKFGTASQGEDMSLFTVFATLITITALLSYLNERTWRLPPSIGVMAAALAASIGMIVLGQFGWFPAAWVEDLVGTIDFDAVLMRGMLSFLLFAGALHVDLGDLLERKWSILSMATVGVLLSTFLVGTTTWFLLGLLGLDLPYVYALLFGALISPTDPIAVLGVLKSAKRGVFDQRNSAAVLRKTPGPGKCKPGPAHGAQIPKKNSCGEVKGWHYRSTAKRFSSISDSREGLWAMTFAQPAQSND